MDLHTASAELKELLDEGHRLTREHVQDAWKIHLERIRESLEADWTKSLDDIYKEHGQEIHGRIEQRLELAVSERISHLLPGAKAAARRELTLRLNQMARRLRGAEDRDAWVRTYVEAAANFAGCVALFSIDGQHLRLERGVRLPEGVADQITIELSQAPALANAASSLDTMVAIATPGQLSDSVAALFSSTAGQKVYLFPLAIQKQAIGVLVAEPDEQDQIDASALELITGIAVHSIGEEVVTDETPPVQTEIPNLIQISAPGKDSEAIKRVAVPVSPGTGQVPTAVMPGQKSQSGPPRTPRRTPKEELAHGEALQFARLKIAALVLNRWTLLHGGRASHNVYGALRTEIDADRDEFRRKFLSNGTAIPDYYHQELVSSLARNDASVLGAGYPGPLAGGG